MNTPGIKEIGRFKRFPVKTVKLIKRCPFWLRWLGVESVAVLTDGSSYHLNKLETELLENEIELWNGVLFVDQTLKTLKLQS